MVPLAGLIDLDAERARINKEASKAQQELEKIEKKLGNEAFVAKAPEAVVAALGQASFRPPCRP